MSSIDFSIKRFRKWKIISAYPSGITPKPDCSSPKSLLSCYCAAISASVNKVMTSSMAMLCIKTSHFITIQVCKLPAIQPLQKNLFLKLKHNWAPLVFLSKYKIIKELPWWLSKQNLKTALKYMTISNVFL